MKKEVEKKTYWGAVVSFVFGLMGLVLVFFIPLLLRDLQGRPGVIEIVLMILYWTFEMGSPLVLVTNIILSIATFVKTHNNTHLKGRILAIIGVCLAALLFALSYLVLIPGGIAID